MGEGILVKSLVGDIVTILIDYLTPRKGNLQKSGLQSNIEDNCAYLQ